MAQVRYRGPGSECGFGAGLLYAWCARLACVLERLLCRLWMRQVPLRFVARECSSTSVAVSESWFVPGSGSPATVYYGCATPSVVVNVRQELCVGV